MDRHPAHEESMYENAARDAQRREVEGLHGRIAEQQAENERLRAKCAEKDAAMASVISAWNGGYVQNHSATMYAAIVQAERAITSDGKAYAAVVEAAANFIEQYDSEEISQDGVAHTLNGLREALNALHGGDEC